jgi:hypothetical protein
MPKNTTRISKGSRKRSKKSKRKEKQDQREISEASAVLRNAEDEGVFEIISKIFEGKEISIKEGLTIGESILDLAGIILPWLL